MINVSRQVAQLFLLTTDIAGVNKVKNILIKNHLHEERWNGC